MQIAKYLSQFCFLLFDLKSLYHNENIIKDLSNIEFYVITRLPIYLFIQFTPFNLDFSMILQIVSIDVAICKCQVVMNFGI